MNRLFLLTAAVTAAAFTACADDYAVIKEKLAKEPAISCQVVFDQEVPSFRINGKNYPRLLQYTCDYPWKFDQPGFTRQIGRLKKAGIRFYTVGITPCERTTAGGNAAAEDQTAFEKNSLVKPDPRKRARELWEEDFLALDLVEKRIYRALELDPDAYFMVYITLSYPNAWWMNKHPDELVRYATMPVDPKARLGEQAFRVPSFASQLYRQQACEVLAKLVQYLESTPAAKRVFAYRIDYGCFREWFLYGFADKLLPDVSLPMQRAFRAYLRERYHHDVKALRAAWHDPDVLFDTAQIPAPQARLKLGNDMLRDPVEAAPVLDYLRALHGQILETNVAFNRAVKEASNFRVPVGNYGGYFFGMHFGPEHRHFYNDRLLKSGMVDFQISPFMYTKFRKMGESGFAENMFESVSMHNVMGILEADTSTHLDTDKVRKVNHLTPANSRDASALLARDFGQILARRAGIHWKDFNKQFYDDDDVEKTFTAFTRINRLPAAAPVLKSQVAVVGDFESLIYMCARRWDKLYPQVVSDLQMELTHSGTNFETLAFTDLTLPGADRFQVYLFPNFFYATPQKLAVLEKLKKQNKILLFSYAPGYLTPQGRSLETMNQLLGSRFSAFPGTFKPGRIMRTAPGIYYSTDGRWPRAEIQKLLKENGVHVYNQNTEPILYAGGNFLTVHTAKGGAQTIALPHKMRVMQCFPETGKTQETAEIRFMAPANSTTIFFVR